MFHDKIFIMAEARDAKKKTRNLSYIYEPLNRKRPNPPAERPP